MRVKLTLLAVLFILSTLFGGAVMAQDMSEVTILYWQASFDPQSLFVQWHQGHRRLVDRA